MLYISTLVLLGISIFAGRILIQQLRVRHASSVYLVWYLFSLASFVTCVALWWSVKIGAINQGGIGVSPWGKFVMKMIVMSMDVPEEVNGLLALVGAIVVPQVAAYLLSGISGCAVRPRLVSLCVDFLSLSVAKTLSVTAGVLFGITFVGLFHPWTGFDNPRLTEYSLVVVLTLMFSFFVLASRTALDEWPLFANHPKMVPVRQLLTRVDDAMTRHSEEDGRRGISVAQLLTLCRGSWQSFKRQTTWITAACRRFQKVGSGG